MSNIPLVDFNGKLLNVLEGEIGDRLFAFTLGKFGQARDANQEGGLADPLFVLLREELQEVPYGRGAVESLLNTHSFRPILASQLAVFLRGKFKI